MTDTIRFSRSGHVARLTLNHPERHNSLGREQLDAINGYIDDIEADSELRVLVVSGEGDKTFCAGASLAELGAGAMADDAFQVTTGRLAGLSIPTLCAMNGNVFGGGVEVAVSCDFRFGVEGMRMRVPAASLGLCYPVSGIERYVESLGVSVTKRILVAAEEFDTDTLVSIGFLHRVLGRDDLQATASDFAEHIASLAPIAVQSMKAILGQAAAGSIDIENAQKLVTQSLESADLQEGFAAQREKRKPVFQGQ
jgi:enoyl-CoA hydratase/carnithine racemase